jgi:hypothetical protein
MFFARSILKPGVSAAETGSRATRLNRWPILLALLFHIAVMSMLLAKYDGNFSAFIGVGQDMLPSLVNPLDALGAGTIVYKNAGENDGQFYYLLARHPLSALSIFIPGARRGEMAFRCQRILYPLCASLLCFGKREILPVMMVILNLLALVCGMAFLQKLLIHRGASQWLSLIFALSMGTLSNIRYDMTGLWETGLVLGCLWYGENRRWLPAAALLSLSFLTRETAIIALAPLVLYAALKREMGGAWLLLSPAPWLLYKIVLREMNGIPILASGSAWAIGKSLPFATLAGFIRNIPGEHLSPVQLMQTLSALLFLFFVIGCGFRALRELRSPPAACLLLLFQVALVPFAPQDFFSGVSDMSRILVGIFPFLVLLFAERKSRSGALLLIGGIFFTVPGLLFYAFQKTFTYFCL